MTNTMKAFFYRQTSSLLFLLTLTFVHCQPEKSTNSNQLWDRINIQLDGQTITISRQNGYPIYSRILVPVDTIENFKLTKEQKDSIYIIVDDLIKNPVTPKHHVNAGVADNATFSVDYKQVALTVDYKYLKSWRDLSDKTKTLYSILARKTKFRK